MASFGSFSVRLDPWDVDYGSEIPVDGGASSAAADRVDLGVEVTGPFSPIVPRPIDPPEEIVFVDGVRRADARVLVTRATDDSANGMIHGLFATFATGSTVVSSNGRARWGEASVRRVLAVGGGIPLPPMRVEERMTFEAVSVSDVDPDAPLRALQADMRASEARVARSAMKESALVIVDGPLTFDTPDGGQTVGFVKRIHELYIGAEARVLTLLSVGERTPLFALRSSNRFARYSWFLRLGRPFRGESPMTGLVRMEVAERVGLEEAQRLADLTARCLPRLAPSRGRDPRSPQNLMPIGALENHLRRLLGDRRLVRRHIQTFLARGASA